jgi:hypothetical protein
VQVIPASVQAQPGCRGPTQAPQLDCATEPLGQTKVPSLQTGSVTTSWLHPPMMQESFTGSPVQAALLLLPHPSKPFASTSNPNTLNKLNIRPELYPDPDRTVRPAGWDPVV